MTQSSKEEKNNFETRAWRHIKEKSFHVTQQYLTVLTKIMQADVFPVLGQYEPGTITPEQLLSALKLVQERHGIDFAHQICTLCGEVFTKCIVDGICQWNPANVARNELAPRKRHTAPILLTTEQFASRLIKIGGYSGLPVFGAALRLSVLLLVRSGETCRAEWKDIIWDQAIWRYKLPIPAMAHGRMQSHYVPLSTQSLCILRELQLLTGGGRFVFPKPDHQLCPIEPIMLRRELGKMGFQKKAAGFNALRALARQLLVLNFGIPEEAVKQQLGHRRIDRKDCDDSCGSCLRQRRTMMQVWADSVGSAMRPEGTLHVSLSLQRAAVGVIYQPE